MRADENRRQLTPHGPGMPEVRRVPVTVVCGFSGVGKTVVIDRLVRQSPGERFAVITHAGGRGRGSGYAYTPATVCHTRTPMTTFLVSSITTERHDVLRHELWQKIAAGAFDGVFLEAAGGVEPAAIVSVLNTPVPGYALADVMTVEAIVTVLDCATLQDDYASTDTLAARGLAVDAGDDRSVANVIAAQIESADLLVLNKTDLASAQNLPEVHDIAAVLNPGAHRVETCFGDGTGTTPANIDADGADTASADGRPGWLCTLDRALLRTQAYRVERLVYQRRRPFHPERLMRFIDTDWPWTLRTRGQFWIASRPDWAGDIQQAGRSVSIRPFGYWWASDIVGGCTPDEPTLRDELSRLWHPVYGDRRQHIAVLGVDMDIDALEQRLDACLLTDAELVAGWDRWRELSDPWPAWG